MDDWYQQHHPHPFDKNGDWAGSGHVIPALLQQMLQHPFFQMPPPKSTGRDLFNRHWLQHYLSQLPHPPAAEDIQATLLQLTTQAITNSIQQYCPDSTQIFLCGGGSHNKALIQQLQQQLPDIPVNNTRALGIDPDYVEALTFAWLARQHRQNQPGNLPSATGAKKPCILGAWFPA